jgi:opacity protein-like surface antigen
MKYVSDFLSFCRAASKIASIAAFAVSAFSISASAAHPMITDDAGTQGKGKMQFELNSGYAKDKDDGTTVKSADPSFAYTLGIAESLDFSLSIPYSYRKTESGSVSESEKGLSDISVAAKLKFFDNERFSFAFKPSISFPTGDEKKDLGSGKTGYQAFFIGTASFEPAAVHINAGYIRNENKNDERVNLWHLSLAAEYAIVQNFRIVADIGMEKNSDKENTSNPAYLLGGVIWSVNDHLDLDAGYKHGITDPEDDHTVMAGITVKL